MYNDRAKSVALQRQLYKVRYLLPDLKLEENAAFSHFEDIKTSKNIFCYNIFRIGVGK